MPEKVTSYGLKVTSEYCSYNYGAHNVYYVKCTRTFKRHVKAAGFVHVKKLLAHNFDEGGTLPGTALGTFSIVPLIADSVKSVPVMAAGGITDSRTARAAHALGAEGVFAGSVFIGTEESRVPQSVKDKIINANGLDLLLFRTLPDYYRSLPGKLADKLVSMDKAGASNEELAQTMGGLRGLRIGMLEGNTDEGYIALGTGIGNIRSIKSVAEVVNELAIC